MLKNQVLSRLFSANGWCLDYFAHPHYVENLEQLAVFGQMVCAFHSGTSCLLLDCSCLLATRSLLPGCEPGWNRPFCRGSSRAGSAVAFARLVSFPWNVLAQTASSNVDDLPSIHVGIHREDRLLHAAVWGLWFCLLESVPELPSRWKKLGIESMKKIHQFDPWGIYMDVSKHRGYPKNSIFIGTDDLNQRGWGHLIARQTHWPCTFLCFFICDNQLYTYHIHITYCTDLYFRKGSDCSSWSNIQGGVLTTGPSTWLVGSAGPLQFPPWCSWTYTL